MLAIHLSDNNINIDKDLALEILDIFGADPQEF
jgi:hypothetical protein